MIDSHGATAVVADTEGGPAGPGRSGAAGW